MDSSLPLGKVAYDFINHTEQYTAIKKCLLSNHLCIITGPRGCGKTTAITYISNSFMKETDWIIITLNTERNILETAITCLYSNKDAKNILGDICDSETPQYDAELVLDKLLHKLTINGKNIIFVIDEIVNLINTKEFLIKLQQHLNNNVYVLGAVDYLNIYNLQNEETISFLAKTQIIEMKPLNIELVMQKYKEFFNLDDINAMEMAKFTTGYPFAYMLLAQLCFQKNTGYINVIEEFDSILGDYVYKKLWKELSDGEKNFLKYLIIDDNIKTVRYNLQQRIRHDTNEEILIRKGILNQDAQGNLLLKLPRFKEFLQSYCL